jgi:hypothetical protein
MKKYLLRIVVLLLFVAAAAGCSEVEVQPLRFGDAPWSENEISTYQLTDINGNYAGIARYDLTRTAEDVWNLRREINAQGTQEIIAVEMGYVDFRPLESTLIRIDRRGTEVVTTEYDGNNALLELTTRQNITTIQRISIPSDAREHATLTTILRALPLAENYAVRINVFLPVVGIVERTTVQVAGQEQLSVPAGDFDTWHVLLESPNSKTEVWVSTQSPYPVVKFIDSRNGGTFELSEFQAGE